MTNGLILLGFLALLATILVRSLRRRIGMGVTVRILAITYTTVVIIVLVMWVAQVK